MTWTAEFLLSPPESGSIEEVRIDASRFCSFVRFSSNDGEQWLGVFGKGEMTSKSSVAMFSDGMTAFVASGGIGYVVDVGTQQLTFRTQDDRYMFVWTSPIPDRECVLAASDTHLYIVSREAIEHATERVADDGTELIAVDVSTARLRTWLHGEWRTGELDLDSRQWKVT